MRINLVITVQLSVLWLIVLFGKLQTAFQNGLPTEVEGSPITFRSKRSMPKVGVSFSPAGLLTPFHIGAAAQLKRLGIIDSSTALAGSSGGALAAVTTALDIADSDALTCSVYVAQRCRDEGPRATLRIALDEVLGVMLPADSHERLNKRAAPCCVAYAEIQPRIKAQFVSYYLDKEDVISALRASCNIPFYFNGNSPAVRVRGSYAVDGFFTTPFSRFGCPPTGAIEREILISPYSASLVRLNPEAVRKEGEICRYDVISPDLLASEQWPFSFTEVLRMSFGAPGSKISPGVPISDEELTEIYQQLFQAGAQAVTNWHNSFFFQDQDVIQKDDTVGSKADINDMEDIEEDSNITTKSRRKWWKF